MQCPQVLAIALTSFNTEGMMLKPLVSCYNDRRSHLRWVKLKKDFIPGAGDTLDFHIVGARWSRDRGRELLGQSADS